jgi:tRNA A37 N6-isopentenylltransferase MiaA
LWLIRDETEKYLREANAYLFAWNTANFIRLKQGLEVPGLVGQRGKQLDYGLVDFEQQKLEDFTIIYFAGEPPSLKQRIIRDLNSTMSSGLGSEIVRQAFTDRFTNQGTQFSFDRMNDRVQLGYGIIDLRYDERVEF